MATSGQKIHFLFLYPQSILMRFRFFSCFYFFLLCLCIEWKGNAFSDCGVRLWNELYRLKWCGSFLFLTVEKVKSLNLLILSLFYWGFGVMYSWIVSMYMTSTVEWHQICIENGAVYNFWWTLSHKHLKIEMNLR